METLSKLFLSGVLSCFFVVGRPAFVRYIASGLARRGRVLRLHAFVRRLLVSSFDAAYTFGLSSGLCYCVGEPVFFGAGGHARWLVEGGYSVLEALVLISMPAAEIFPVALCMGLCLVWGGLFFGVAQAGASSNGIPRVAERRNDFRLLRTLAHPAHGVSLGLLGCMYLGGSGVLCRHPPPPYLSLPCQ